MFLGEEGSEFNIQEITEFVLRHRLSWIFRKQIQWAMKRLVIRKNSSAVIFLAKMMGEPISKYATLVFEVEMLEIRETDPR